MDTKEKIKLQSIRDNLNDAEVTRYTSGLISKETYVHDVTFLMEYIDELEEQVSKLNELVKYIDNHNGIPGWD